MGTVAQQLIAAAAALAMVIGPSFLALWFMLRRKRKAREDRRSPLTSDLLRGPGHQLREKLEDARLDAASDLMVLMVIPGLALATLHTTLLVTGKLQPTGILVIVLVGIAVFSARQIRVLLRNSEYMDQLRLGLDAELAVGQELDQLMRQGAVVFHDVPGEKFNVDHVVIAQQGVFAVETKGYRKPNRDGGSADATVVYDGDALKFPDWSSNKPIAQSQRQAAWLAQWLRSATGEAVVVTPVLALPGWFVDRQGRGTVVVFGRTELQRFLLKARDARPLNAEQMQRIVHQVEQRCRDVKPSYRPLEED